MCEEKFANLSAAVERCHLELEGIAREAAKLEESHDRRLILAAAARGIGKLFDEVLSHTLAREYEDWSEVEDVLAPIYNSALSEGREKAEELLASVRAAVLRNYGIDAETWEKMARVEHRYGDVLPTTHRACCLISFLSEALASRNILDRGVLSAEDCEIVGAVDGGRRRTLPRAVAGMGKIVLCLSFFIDSNAE